MEKTIIKLTWFDCLVTPHQHYHVMYPLKTRLSPIVGQNFGCKQPWGHSNPCFGFTHTHTHRGGKCSQRVSPFFKIFNFDVHVTFKSKHARSCSNISVGVRVIGPSQTGHVLWIGIHEQRCTVGSRKRKRFLYHSSQRFSHAYTWSILTSYTDSVSFILHRVRWNSENVVFWNVMNWMDVIERSISNFTCGRNK